MNQTLPPTRAAALALLQEFNSNPSLINHALAVEAAMRFLARKNQADEEQWGVIGLIHDLDYERYPAEHCKKTAEILRERGWPEGYIQAVSAHGWGVCTDVAPESSLEKTLYAVDELTGLITACALVRPSKSVMDLTAQSVRKKWKQPSFAAGVNREIIRQGAAMLGMDLDALVTDVIAGMREVAAQIGLAGQPAANAPAPGTQI